MSREAFESWAPPGNEWSQWAKPAPFITDALSSAAAPTTELKAADSNLSATGDLCLVLDLPGPEAVRWGVSLAKAGFVPVQLINTTFGVSEAVPMGEVLSELKRGATELKYLQRPDNGKPVFILDSRREGAGYVPVPKSYDNRWMVFPQDFPSGNYLAARGVKRAMVMMRENTLRKDLAHVLRRWQDAGIKIMYEVPGDGAKPVEFVVEKPSMFKLGWYRFLAAAGLHRNSAGGFGSRIPEPSQGGHG